MAGFLTASSEVVGREDKKVLAMKEPLRSKVGSRKGSVEREDTDLGEGAAAVMRGLTGAMRRQSREQGREGARGRNDERRMVGVRAGFPVAK